MRSCIPGPPEISSHVLPACDLGENPLFDLHAVDSRRTGSYPAASQTADPVFPSASSQLTLSFTALASSASRSRLRVQAARLSSRKGPQTASRGRPNSRTLNPLLEQQRHGPVKKVDSDRDAKGHPTDFDFPRRRAVSMRSSFKFVTVPTSDNQGTSLELQFEHKHYFFGHAGEGFQRAIIEQGIRVAKVSQIFLTGTTRWRNVGGLLGLSLGMADVAMASSVASAESDKRKRKGAAREEKQTLHIYGPANINYMLATARAFIFRNSLPIVAHDIPAELAAACPSAEGPATQVFKDENIMVWAIGTEPLSTASDGDPERPVQERKRSHAEMSGAEDGDAEANISLQSSLFDMTKNLVVEMFGSTWRNDSVRRTSIQYVPPGIKMFERDETTKKLKVYEGPTQGQDGYNPRTKVLIREPWPGQAMVKHLSVPKPSHTSMSYLVKSYPVRGKFNPQRARELGLLDVRQYRLITAGQSIPNDKGQIITPDMVLDSSKPPAGFLFAELPSRDYVRPFLEQLKGVNTDVMENLACYCWTLGPGVYDDVLLQDFIQHAGAVQHIVSSPDICRDRYTYETSTAATVKLSALDSARYKVPSLKDPPSIGNMRSNVAVAEAGLAFNLQPSQELSRDSITPGLDVESVKEDLVPEAKQASLDAEQAVIQDSEALARWASKIPNPDAEVITLGTGSSLPSKHRNVSSTLVRVPGWGSILLDCGENTVGQLRRVFNPAEFEELMRDLRCLYVSHLHADHHLGSASVLREWYATVHGSQPAPPFSLWGPFDRESRPSTASTPRLTVLSDHTYLRWLSEYSQLEDIGYSRIAPIAIQYQSATSESWLGWYSPPRNDEGGRQQGTSAYEVIPSDLGFADIQACKVRHCQGAWAVALTLPSGFKVAYSGDCRPSQRFAEIGRGATVCVHEATFDDSMIEDARVKRHSTTGEALRIASRMRAKAVVLTHFSQRYVKLPVIEYVDEEECEADKATLDEDEGAVDEEADLEEDGAFVKVETQAGPPARPGDRGGGGSERDEGAQDAEPGPTGGGCSTASFRLRADRDMKVCVAFDLMCVRVGDMAQMDKFAPALVAMYDGEERLAAAKKEAARREAMRVLFEVEERKAVKRGLMRGETMEGLRERVRKMVEAKGYQ